MDEVKPGWKTTEFWLSMAAMIIGAVMASGVLVAGHWVTQVVGIAASVLGALGYTMSRGLVKGKTKPVVPQDPTPGPESP